jgi:hypothetical protein
MYNHGRGSPRFIARNGSIQESTDLCESLSGFSGDDSFVTEAEFTVLNLEDLVRIYFVTGAGDLPALISGLPCSLSELRLRNEIATIVRLLLELELPLQTYTQTSIPMLTGSQPTATPIGRFRAPISTHSKQPSA